MDRVFSLMGGTTGVEVESYDLISYGCMILAAKFEELDMKIPLIQDLMAASKFKLSYH
jgi:Cyclin, C-terminal domain/Cyclin, N-terminal domain